MFGLQCCYCLAKYNTLQQAKQHFTQECSWLPAVKIKCEFCSTTFRHWGECTVHLNVKGAHLRKRPKVIVVSTTSSSEGVGAAPIKTETRPDTPMVARREVHSPARQPSPALVASSTPPAPSLSASQADLTVPEVEAEVRREGTFVGLLTTPATSPTSSVTYSGLTQPTIPPATTQLQIGTSAVTADTWRSRFYALAHHTRYWVHQVAQAEITAAPTQDQLASRWGLALDWPSGMDLTVPLSELASSLLPYYADLADPDLEPDIGNF